MTNTILDLWLTEYPDAGQEPMRCDACGRPVTDPRRHLDQCIERELALFAAGRRPN